MHGDASRGSENEQSQSHGPVEGRFSRCERHRAGVRLTKLVVPSMGSTMNVGSSVRSTRSPPAKLSSPMNLNEGYLSAIERLMNASTAWSVSVTTVRRMPQGRCQLCCASRASWKMMWGVGKRSRRRGRRQ